jgi:hypothetical protein
MRPCAPPFSTAATIAPRRRFQTPSTTVVLARGRWDESLQYMHCVAVAENVRLIGHIQAIWPAATSSRSIPKKRLEFSARKSCVEKRSRIRDESSVPNSVDFWRFEETVQNPSQLANVPSILNLTIQNQSPPPSFTDLLSKCVSPLPQCGPRRALDRSPKARGSRDH